MNCTILFVWLRRCIFGHLPMYCTVDQLSIPSDAVQGNGCPLASTSTVQANRNDWCLWIRHLDDAPQAGRKYLRGADDSVVGHVAASSGNGDTPHIRPAANADTNQTKPGGALLIIRIPWTLSQCNLFVETTFKLFWIQLTKLTSTKNKCVSTFKFL